MKGGRIRAGFALLCMALLSSCAAPTPPASPAVAPPSPATATAPGAAVTGLVLDPGGAPLARATVRVQATANSTLSDSAGHFRLSGLAAGTPVTISAWGEGYYCAKVESVTPPADGITITMRAVQTNDNPAYQWIAPTGENSCYSCKPGVTQVWLDSDAHGRSAINLRFLTMYNGTDVEDRRSPPTHYATSRDYGRIPLAPDVTEPYFGPGYKLDFPDTSGNCAACHVPGAAVDAPYATDPNLVSGVDTFGVHCDYCHKVADVRLEPATGLPYPNMPGVLSQDIRRPFPEDKARYQLFFGSFDDDNVPMEDTYLPLIKDSRWCAPCHFGVFWDTVVYNSFGEWLASPYSDPATGKTCQQCHMPAPTVWEGQPITNVAPGKAGVERDPMAIPAHTFPGASSTELLRNAVTLTASAQRDGTRLVVDVTILNDKTGHHVPTDSPLRQMILVVSATGAQGRELPLQEGPTLPWWTGEGDPADGNLAGLPGVAYAKILEELWTQVSPTGAYWNPTRVQSDNRLPAFASDTNRFTFTAPDGPAQVTVQLLFRRAFKELVEQKGWDVPDIEMALQTVEVP